MVRKFLGATITFTTDNESDVTVWESAGNDCWIGISPEPQILEDQPWTLLEYEDDYLGIFQQLMAEDLGYV